MQGPEPGRFMSAKGEELGKARKKGMPSCQVGYGRENMVMWKEGIIGSYKYCLLLGIKYSFHLRAYDLDS